MKSHVDWGVTEKAVRKQVGPKKLVGGAPFPVDGAPSGSFKVHATKGTGIRGACHARVRGPRPSLR